MLFKRLWFRHKKHRYAKHVRKTQSRCSCYHFASSSRLAGERNLESGHAALESLWWCVIFFALVRFDSWSTRRTLFNSHKIIATTTRDWYLVFSHVRRA